MIVKTVVLLVLLMVQLTLAKNAIQPANHTTIAIATTGASPTAATTAIVTTRSPTTKPDPCAAVTCMQNEVCVPDTASNNFTCKCRGGFEQIGLTCKRFPIATAMCELKSPSRASFGSTTYHTCALTTESAISIAMQSLTTSSVSTLLRNLNYLTSFSGLVTNSAAKLIVSTLNKLDESVLYEVADYTLDDLLAVVDHVIEIYYHSDLSNDPTFHAEMLQLIMTVESFAGRVILSSGLSEQDFSSKNMFIKVLDITSDSSKQYSDLSYNSTKSLVASITVPGSVLQQAAAATKRSSVRMSIYSYFNNFFFPSSSNQSVSQVVQALITGATMQQTNADLKVTFTNEKARQGGVPLPSNPLKETVTKTQCVTWDAVQRVWVPNGCSLVHGSNPPTCACNRLANFAMIVSVKVLPSAFALGIASAVGCSLSIIGLAITICVYSVVGELRQRKPTMFLLNICSCMLLSNVIFMIGTTAVNNRIACHVMTALFHYFLLTTWFWMGFNAVNMYLAFVTVVGNQNWLRKTSIYVSYLLTLAVTVATACVAIIYFDSKTYRADNIFFESVYRARHVCWLHSFTLYLGFLLPVAVLIIIEFVLFAIILRSLTQRKNNVRSSLRKNTLKRDFMTATQLIFLMGLTWVFGFLMLFADNVIYREAVAWMFTILNSFQGLVIFYVNCVKQDQVRKLWWDPCLQCFIPSFGKHPKPGKRKDTILTVSSTNH